MPCACACDKFHRPMRFSCSQYQPPFLLSFVMSVGRRVAFAGCVRRKIYSSLPRLIEGTWASQGWQTFLKGSASAPCLLGKSCLALRREIWITMGLVISYLPFLATVKVGLWICFQSRGLACDECPWHRMPALDIRPHCQKSLHISVVMNHGYLHQSVECFITGRSVLGGIFLVSWGSLQ